MLGMAVVHAFLAGQRGRHVDVRGQMLPSVVARVSDQRVEIGYYILRTRLEETNLRLAHQPAHTVAVYAVA